MNHDRLFLCKKGRHLQLLCSVQGLFRFCLLSHIHTCLSGPLQVYSWLAESPGHHVPAGLHQAWVFAAEGERALQGLQSSEVHSCLWAHRDLHINTSHWVQSHFLPSVLMFYDGFSSNIWGHFSLLCWLTNMKVTSFSDSSLAFWLWNLSKA